MTGRMKIVLKGFKNRDKKELIFEMIKRESGKDYRGVSRSKPQGRKMTHAAISWMDAKGKTAFLKTRKSV